MSRVGAIGGRRRLVAGIAASALVHGGAVALVLVSDPVSVTQPPEQVVPLDIAMFASEPIEVARTPSAPTPEPTALVENAPLPEPTPQPQAQPRVEIRPVPPPVEPKPIVKPKPKPKPKARPIAQPKPKSPPRRHREERPRAPVVSPAPMTTTTPRQLAKPPSDAVASGSRRAMAKSPTEGVRQASAPASNKGAERAYLAALQAAIAARQQYPAEARRSGRVGTVTVAFVILADGQITQVRLAKGSGVPALDSAALDALRRLGHFRPIPVTLGRASLALRVPVRFDLRR